MLLAALGAACAVPAVGLLLAWRWVQPPSTLTPEPPTPEWLALRGTPTGHLLDHIGVHGGVRVTIATRVTNRGDLRFGPASRDDVERCAPVLAEELDRYPASFLARAGVEELILGQFLVLGGLPMSGFAPEAAICIDVADGEDDWRWVVHHELFHHVDRKRGTLVHDAEWAALNTLGFRYGLRSRSPRNRPGFLTRYATTAASEDKADTYAYLMTSPRQVAYRAARDSVVLRKRDTMRTRMEDFCAELPAGFGGTEYP